MGVVLGVVAHVCEAAQIGAMVWRLVGAPWVCLLTVWSCSDRGEGVAGRCGVSARSLEVAKIVSFAPGISRYKTHYIYKVLVYFQTKIALN